MPLTIQGIKITKLAVEQSGNDELIKAGYELIASNGKVLASRSLNSKMSYGEETFVPCADTIKALKDAVALYKRDVEGTLGIETT